MKKLYYFLLASTLTSTFFGMEYPASAGSADLPALDNPFQATLAAEFQVPQIILRIARHSLNKFGLRQMPLICKGPSCAGIAASAISKSQVIRILHDAISQPDDLPKFINIYKNIEPQDTMVIHLSFFDQPFEIQRFTIFHECWHFKQFQSGHYTDDIFHRLMPVDPAYSWNACEKEADIQGARALACTRCIKANAATRGTFPDSMLTPYATRGEMLKIADELPREALCSYHKSMSGISGIIFRLIPVIHSPARLFLAINGFGNYIVKNWLGGINIERRIAGGELEP